MRKILGPDFMSYSSYFLNYQMLGYDKRVM
jgi:hypothetical protein